MSRLRISFGKKIRDGVIVWAMFLGIVAGVGAMAYYSMRYDDGYRDGYDGPDRSNQFHNR